jgi:hypothetical protein
MLNRTGLWPRNSFTSKGNRNNSILVVALKLVVQVRHLLSGNALTMLEAKKRIAIQL